MEKLKLLLSLEWQLIKVEGMKEMENQHLATIREVSFRWESSTDAKAGSWRFDEEHSNLFLKNSVQNTNQLQKV